MKIADVTDITVSLSGNDRAVVQWLALGHRYHINVNRQAEIVLGFLSKKKNMFRNPLPSVQFGDPGFYRTVQSNAEAAQNVRVVNHVIAHVRSNRMIELAYEAEANALKAATDAREQAVLEGVCAILSDYFPTGHLTVEQAKDIQYRMTRL